MGWKGIELRAGTRNFTEGRAACDTSVPLAATYPVKEKAVLQRARSRASLLVATSVEFYRELTVSAFSLVRR